MINTIIIHSTMNTFLVIRVFFARTSVLFNLFAFIFMLQIATAICVMFRIS